MKRHNNTCFWAAGCFLLMGLLSSCSKDFLDREPYIGSLASNFYQTADDAEAAVIACYAPLQLEITEGAHFRWWFGDIVSDDADKGGSGDTDAPDLLEFSKFTGDAASTIVLGEWKTAYKGIAYCNTVLQNVPPIEMDELEKLALLGEAQFLRAFWYFNLVTTFGGVPLVTQPLAPSEYAQPRATAEEVWAQIVLDLEEASANLPEKSAYSTSQTGRATRGAANALLAKTHMYLGNWSECRTRCEEVVGSGEYSLDPNYGNIFTEAGENGSGSIWEIQYANNSGGNWGAQFWSEGSYTNVFQRARGSFSGYGFNLPTQDFVDEFEVWEEQIGPDVITKTDPRLGYTVYKLGDNVSDWGELTEDATGMPHPYYARKFFNPAAELAPFGDPNPNGGSNDRVIRLADVLLMHAEACNQLGDDEAAKVSLKMVRDRAAVPWSAVADLTGDALLEAIYHERRVELGLEGHRFYDLVRQGRASEVLEGFVPGKSELFPIPTAEITLSNGQLTQNPGYE
ncbi:MAG: RagB/SusD family nutrient uptake outer membrane protein [Flavobacteriales bacterium]